MPARPIMLWGGWVAARGTRKVAGISNVHFTPFANDSYPFAFWEEINKTLSAKTLSTISTVDFIYILVNTESSTYRLTPMRA